MSMARFWRDQGKVSEARELADALLSVVDSIESVCGPNYAPVAPAMVAALP